MLTPEMKQEGQTILGIAASVIAVVKAFRNIAVLKFAAEEAGLKKAPLPCETRWNTLEWWLTNWATLCTILDRNKKAADIATWKTWA